MVTIIKARTGYGGLHQFCPQVERRLVDFIEVIERAESDVAVGQCRQWGRFRHVRRRTVAPQAVRHPQQAFGIGELPPYLSGAACASTTLYSMADKPVVPEISQDKVSWTGAGLRAKICKRLPSVCPAKSTRMSIPVIDNRLSGSIISALKLPGSTANGRRNSGNGRCIHPAPLRRNNRILPHAICHDWPESGSRKYGDRMMPEIRRHIADAQTSIGIAGIRIDSAISPVGVDKTFGRRHGPTR